LWSSAVLNTSHKELEFRILYCTDIHNNYYVSI
jgi:hypothetical protein